MLREVKDLEIKRAIYRCEREGNYYFPSPPVCTAQWTEMDWIRYIDHNGHWIIIPNNVTDNTKE